MPRVKPLDQFEKKKREISAWIRSGAILSGVTMKQLSKKTAIPESTLNYRVRKPETLRLEEIWKIEGVIGERGAT